jgi:hypothetical protein
VKLALDANLQHRILIEHAVVYEKKPGYASDGAKCERVRGMRGAAAEIVMCIVSHRDDDQKTKKTRNVVLSPPLSYLSKNWSLPTRVVLVEDGALVATPAWSVADTAWEAGKGYN